jgi:hypothetical protein
MPKSELRKISTKNYLILAAIIAVCIGLVIYLCVWYHVFDEQKKDIPVIRGTLSEINSDELDHYVLDNPSTVVYMCTSSSLECRSYEKDFKKLIENKSLQNYIVYLNLSNVDSTTFVNNFNNTYKYRIKLTSSYPALVIFEDGKVTSILEGTNNSKLTIDKTKQFIELNQIGE